MYADNSPPLPINVGLAPEGAQSVSCDEAKAPSTPADFHKLAERWGRWEGESTPVPADESLRLSALSAYEVLGTPPEEGFDRIARLAARTLGVPTALVSLVAEDRQWLKACVGLPGVRETGRNVAFCARTILQNEPLVVTDATLDPRFRDNPLVTGWPRIRFYVGMPLRTPDGQNVGSLCAIDAVPREATPEMLESLRDLAALVVDELDLRKALRESEARKRSLAEAEERYRHLAESIQGMVFHAVQRGPQHFEYEYASVGSLDLFGLLPEQVVGDRDALRRLVHPDDLEGAYRAIGESLRTGRPYLWEGRFVVDGRERWVRASGRGEAEPGGETSWRGVMVDVTESHARESTLAESKAEAERASRAKGEFLSRVSHELRTPLNAILGFAQTLAMEDLEPEARQDVAEIDRAGHHLLGLVNEVLDLSAAEARPAPSESTSVGEALAEVYGLLRPLMDEREIRLRAVHLCGGTRVLADPGRLRQVVINVITNAVKYNRPGGSVRVRTEVDPEGTVAIAISDEGPGIAPERIARLFTPFDRLGAEESGVEGTGLGLAIARGLVEAMGGKVEVASEVGAGSTFTILVPAAPSSAVAA